MDSENGPINLSTLDELTFKRSKWWSAFLEEIGEDDQTEVCNIDEVEEKYKDEFADEIGRININEAEESDVIEDVEHHSLLKVMTEHERNSFIESSDVQDFLNATRPILEEHDRKWRKAGLDRILNTFDSVRIEKEVGDWMRRNHSSTVANVEYGYHTDSSSSCDTERYIRSTRKNGFRRRSSIKTIKKFANSQNIRQRHGMLIEATMYRAYKCNCCKQKFNESNRTTFQSTSNERHVSYDSDDNDNDIKRRASLQPASLRRSRWVSPFRRQYESSTDSDCASFKNPIIRGRSAFMEQAGRFDLGDKNLSNIRQRKRLHSMTESNYETPSKSSPVADNIINTAPPKVSNKREAAVKALTNIKKNRGLCDQKNLSTPKVSNKREAAPKALANIKKNGNLRNRKSLSELTPNKNNSNDDDSTFARDLEKAIALSLETHAKNHKHAPVNTDTILLPNTDSKSPPKPLKISTIQIASKNFSQAREDAKENTFFTNAENICNSTALNGAAARNQLISRLPSISESRESPSTALYTAPPDPKICLNMIGSMLRTASDYEKEKQFKNVYNSTALNGVGPEKAILTPSSPKPEQTRPRVSVSEPRQIPLRGRKSSLGAANGSYELRKSNATKGPYIAEKMSKHRKSARILLYKPQQKQQEPGGYINVTKELLSDIIGEKDACRFMKHHLGRLSFPNTSTIYYCPPEEELSSSDSDDDPLERLDRCGELYESVLHDEKEVV